MKAVAIVASLIATSMPALCSELTKAVLQSADLIDIYPKLKGTRYEVGVVEQVPDKLFDIILDGKGTDEEWRALDHYSDLTDAGASLDFMHSCFKALRKDRLIFYHRFLAGDSTALQWMRDALSDDFSAYQRATKLSYERHRVFYQDVLKTINKNRAELSGLALKKHDEFMQAARRAFEQWKARYRGKI